MKRSKYSRLDIQDKEEIIRDLELWGKGEVDKKLTWTAMEARFGFTRQALSAHDEIKFAKRNAEAALKSRPKFKEATADEVFELKNEINYLCAKVEEHERREKLWRERWQRIAFNIRLKGMQVAEIDAPLDAGLPDDNSIKKILKPFDKPIPPSKSFED